MEGLVAAPKTFQCIQCKKTKKRKYVGLQKVKRGGIIERTCKVCVKLPTLPTEP
jgi:hypothetical protein